MIQKLITALKDYLKEKEEKRIDRLMDRIDRLPPDEQKSVDRLIDKLLSRKKGKGKDD